MKLDLFFNPRHIAILGASNNKNKVGRKVLDNLKVNKALKLYPINHKYSKIVSLKAYKTISSIDLNKWEELLLIIAIPSQFVVDEFKKAVQLGVRNIVIISAGFKEHDLEGKKMEDAIIEIAEKHGVNVLGPNCLGYININSNINASFADYALKQSPKLKNNIALISQSGAIGSAVLDWIRDKNISLSYFVSLGNKSVINENHVLEHILKDKKTDLVLLYLENILDGAHFLEIVSKLSQKKVVAILKSAKTSVGKKMAISHTGSLTGSIEATKAALKRSGAIVLDNIGELYATMNIFKSGAKLQDGDLAVVSNAGGPAVLIGDELALHNLSLKAFNKETSQSLSSFLPSFAKIANPLDILGDADSARYAKSVELLLADKKISTVLVLLTLQSVTDVDDIAKSLVLLQKKYSNKKIFTCFLGGIGLEKANNILKEAGIVNFQNPESFAAIYTKIDSYLKQRDSLKIYQADKYINLEHDFKAIVLDYMESYNIFKKNGFKLVDTKKIDYNNLANFQYPLVIKYAGPDFIHKSDKKAVFLNVKDKKSAKNILDDLMKSIKSKKIGQDNYAVAQNLLKSEIELILGFKRDPVFGPIIMFGLGGIYTETYKDLAFDLNDIDYKRAQKMIESLRIYPILKGSRGKKGLDIKKLIKLILAFADLSIKHKEIQEIDLNPLMIDGDDVKIADFRIVI